MNRYVFYVLQPVAGSPEVDTMHQMTSPDLTGDPLKVAMRLSPEAFTGDSAALNSMQIRARCTGAEGPYVILSDQRVWLDDLQAIIDGWHARGILRQQLDKCAGQRTQARTAP